MRTEYFCGRFRTLRSEAGIGQQSGITDEWWPNSTPHGRRCVIVERGPLSRSRRRRGRRGRNRTAGDGSTPIGQATFRGTVSTALNFLRSRFTGEIRRDTSNELLHGLPCSPSVFREKQRGIAASLFNGPHTRAELMSSANERREQSRSPSSIGPSIANRPSGPERAR